MPNRLQRELHPYPATCTARPDEPDRVAENNEQMSPPPHILRGQLARALLLPTAESYSKERISPGQAHRDCHCLTGAGGAVFETIADIQKPATGAPTLDALAKFMQALVRIKSTDQLRRRGNAGVSLLRGKRVPAVRNYSGIERTSTSRMCAQGGCPAGLNACLAAQRTHGSKAPRAGSSVRTYFGPGATKPWYSIGSAREAFGPASPAACPEIKRVSHMYMSA